MENFEEQKSWVGIKLVCGILLALVIPLAGTLMTAAPAVWPISTLVYSFGLLLFFANLTKRAASIVVYNVFAAAFFVVEASFFFSYYLQNAGFNDAFFYHLRPDLLYAGLGEHLLVLVLVFACLFGFLFLSSSSFHLARARKSRVIPFSLILLLSGFYLSPPAKALVLNFANRIPAVEETAELYRQFPELRNAKISIDFNKTKRPNIVLIYAESLEQRYFDENIFPGLLPKLKKLREESIDFKNVSQGVGAEWTIGGIVASQCGYPLTVSHDLAGNDLSLFDEFLPRAKCLGDLLEEDGYRLSFIGGASAIFGGKDKFLKSHGYSEVIDLEVLEENLTDRTYVNDWGIYDDTLFDYAANKFVKLSNGKSPFLLTLLSLDPHGYDGFLSRSCLPYGSGDSSILNSFHCSDQLISKFIERVRSSPYSDNTIIVVLSDHLAMRNQVTSLVNSSEMPSRLTMFVNTPDGRSSVNENPGLHYDIAPTILDVLGYNLEGQIGFGTSLDQGPGYLYSKFGEDEWRNQAANLKSIANTLWNLEVTLDQKGIRFNGENVSLIMGEREFNLRSWGVTNVPLSTLFIFDKNTLKLEKIKTYAFDEGINGGTLSREIFEHKDNIVFAFSRAKNLTGFSDPRVNPEQWVYFFGKAGGDFFLQRAIVGDFQIPIDLIRKCSNSKVDKNILLQRQSILRASSGKQIGAAG